MKIENKQDVIEWLKVLKKRHPLSIDKCRIVKKDGSMSSDIYEVYSDQVIKHTYQDMIDYLESEEVK